MKRKICFLLLSFTLLFIFVSCSSPVTLYATWSDTMDNSIMMNEQFRYTAKLYSEAENAYVESKGTFVYYLNTITFTDSNKNNIYAEWDIRGETLYLNYEDTDGDKISLALYRTGEPVNVGEEEE